MNFGVDPWRVICIFLSSSFATSTVRCRNLNVISRRQAAASFSQFIPTLYERRYRAAHDLHFWEKYYTFYIRMCGGPRIEISFERFLFPASSVALFVDKKIVSLRHISSSKKIKR